MCGTGPTRRRSRRADRIPPTLGRPQATPRNENMTYVERTFTVQQQIGTVVDYLRDFAEAESWDPGTVSCRQESPGPIEVGTPWHNVSRIRGRDTELTYRLDRAEPR